MRKTSFVILIVLMLASGFVILGEAGVHDSGNLLTGGFTEANYVDSDDEMVYVENVHWQIDDAENVSGPLAKHNFSHGTHNITVFLEKSNGVTETYRKQLTVKK